MFSSDRKDKHKHTGT